MTPGKARARRGRTFAAIAALALLAVPATAGGAPPNLRLPASDSPGRQVSSYVEAEPHADYEHAPPAAMEAFRDMKFGVRIHWGLYSRWQPGEESWPFLALSDEERQAYQESHRTWNPQGFDADAWMRFFRRAGMKCFAFTTKHHDGFSLFDTKTRVRRRANWTAPGGPRIEECDVAYSVMETPFRRDIVGELVAAGRRHGLKVDLYFSHPDWYDADFRPYGFHPLQTPRTTELARHSLETVARRHGREVVVVADPTPEETARMMARHREQLRELLTRYGPIDMLCLDLWLGPPVWPALRETVKELRRLQPNVMLRARGIGNYGDYYTPERFVPGDHENTDLPWMVIYPLGRHFSYEPDAAHHKGAKWVVDSLVDAVAKGGNFMVGIGPDLDGRFHPTAIAQLEEVGAWLRTNGGGIYETRPRADGVWREGDAIRFTRSKDGARLHAIALRRPDRELWLQTVTPEARPRQVTLLGHGPVAWRAGTDGLRIEMPASAPDSLAYVFRIELQPAP